MKNDVSHVFLKQRSNSWNYSIILYTSSMLFDWTSCVRLTPHVTSDNNLQNMSTSNKETAKHILMII